MMTDAHCHLYLEEFDKDRDVAVSNAKSAGINKIILPNIDKDSVERMLSVSDSYPGMFYNTLGLHPTSVKDDFKEQLKIIFSYNINIIGIGETGIDLYWDKTYLKEQQESFDFQLNEACERKLPVIIHSRNSLNEVMEIITSYKSRGLSGVFHCYPGNLQQAKKIIDLGLHIGIGGVVTYKNNNMTDVVAGIPTEYILTETDSPYLSPVPLRGKRNEPYNIKYIVEKIAEIKKLSYDIVAEITFKNSLKLFDLD